MSENFICIIAGGRHFNNWRLLKRKCHKILSQVKKPVVIRSGKATGADSLGERFALDFGHGLQEFPANWYPDGKKGKLDRSAGHKRNREMADGNDEFPDKADALIAFWDGKSTGTKGMIEYAQKKGLQVRVIRYDQYE